MRAVRWLSCYSQAALVPAVEWETATPTRHVAAEALAAGRSVILRHVPSTLIGLFFEVDRFAWASTRDAYSYVRADGTLGVNPNHARLVPVEHFARVWSAIVRECARTGWTLYHSEVALGLDRRAVAVAYRANHSDAESMARTVGHWLRLPIVPVTPWRK